MPYIVKLCYLPLLNDNSYYFTQPFQVSKVLVEGGFTANNISFKNDEIMVTVDDTLGGTTNSNLFKSNYNCLLLYNDNKNYFEIYHINQISFIGGKQIRIVGTLSHYTIDKVNVAENEYNYILQNRETLKSKCGFIRYGYAYDSILKADGTVNIDGKGGTDIYKPVEIRNIDLLKYRKKLNFRCVYNTDGTPNDTLSNRFNSFFNGWIYIYCEARTYEFKVADKNVSITVNNLKYSDVDLDVLPYGVVVAPITKTGEIVIGDNMVSSYDFIKNNSPYIYSVKVSGMPPFKVTTDQISFTSDRVTISVNSNNIILNNYNAVKVTPFDSTGDVSGCVVSLISLTSKPMETTPTSYSELYPFYPRGFDKQIVTKQEFENYNYNPYIKGHGTLVRLSDGFGGIKDYTPFDLGFIKDGIVFEYYEALTPDITKIYLTPKIAILEKSLLQLNMDKTYIGLVNNVDLSMPYSQDQLTTFLASNKNFFQQKMVNTLVNFWGETERSANSFVASYFSKSIGGMANAVNRQSEALYDLGLSIYNTNITKDNLKSAPDKLNDVKSNYLWLLLIQEDLKPVIEIYTADDYTLKSAYNRFCEYGIKLDKFIDETEIDKYINIHENLPGLYAHDKLNYKYIEGDVTLYGFYSWYLQQQNRLSRQFSNGVKLINISSELKEDPKVDYDIMLEIKEEEFNFE